MKFDSNTCLDLQSREITEKLLAKVREKGFDIFPLRVGRFSNIFSGDLDVLCRFEDLCLVSHVINDFFDNEFGACAYIRKAGGKVIICVPLGEPASYSDIDDLPIAKIELHSRISLKLNSAHKRIPGYSRGFKMQNVLSYLNSGAASDDNQTRYDEKITDLKLLFMLNQLNPRNVDKYRQDIEELMLSYGKNFASTREKSDQEFLKNREWLLCSIYTKVSSEIATSCILKDFFEKFWLKARHRERPFVVTFSGPDGAGKTTTCGYFMKVWDRLGVRYSAVPNTRVASCFIFWARSKMKPGSRRFGMGRLGTYSDNTVTALPKSKIKISRRWVGLLVAAIDVILFSRIYSLIMLLRLRSVVYETGAFDIFVKRYRPAFYKTESLLVPLIPRHYVSVLCVSSPSAIRDRKPELDIKEIQRYYSRIEILSGGRMCRVPTDSGIKKSLNSLSSCVQ